MKLLYQKKILCITFIIVGLMIIANINVFADVTIKYENWQWLEIGRSDILQRLHNALQVSIESIKLSKNINPLHKKILDYQMFSDCICLSIPIYDTDDDFLSEFASMVLIIATYQYMMLINGFYIRGGISIGSHFSDKSMIFSGGLVKSYFLNTILGFLHLHLRMIVIVTPCWY